MLDLPTPVVVIGLLVLAAIISIIPVGSLDDRLLLVGTVIGVAVAAFLSWWTTYQDERKKTANVRLMLSLEIDHNLKVVYQINSLELKEGQSAPPLAERVAGQPVFSSTAWRSLQGDVPGALDRARLGRVALHYSLLEAAGWLVGESQRASDIHRSEERESRDREMFTGSRHLFRFGDHRNETITQKWDRISAELNEIGNPLAEVMG